MSQRFDPVLPRWYHRALRRWQLTTENCCRWSSGKRKSRKKNNNNDSNHTEIIMTVVVIIEQLYGRRRQSDFCLRRRVVLPPQSETAQQTFCSARIQALIPWSDGAAGRTERQTSCGTRPGNRIHSPNSCAVMGSFHHHGSGCWQLATRSQAIQIYSPSSAVWCATVRYAV